MSPCGLAGRRLPRLQEVVGLNPIQGKICEIFRGSAKAGALRKSRFGSCFLKAIKQKWRLCYVENAWHFTKKFKFWNSIKLLIWNENKLSYSNENVIISNENDNELINN